MTDLELGTVNSLLALKLENIVKIYSGKSGCMCGCNGIYRTPAINKEAAEKSKGYPLQDDEVSDNSVKRILNNMRQTLNELIDGNPNEYELTQEMAFNDLCYISLESRMKDKNYVVYFKK